MIKQNYFRRFIKHTLSLGMLLCGSLMTLPAMYALEDGNPYSSNIVAEHINGTNAMMPIITSSTVVPEVFFDVDTTTPEVFTSEVTIEFSNTGDLPLEYSIAGKLGTSLSLEVRKLSEARGVLESQESVTVNVTLTLGKDAIEDRYMETIDIASNDPSVPVLQIPITVVTSNKRGRFELPGDVSFGSVDIADSWTETFELTNNGLGTILVEDVLSNSSSVEVLEWSTTSGDTMVAIGDALSVTMRFQPTEKRNFNNVLQILSNAALPNSNAAYGIRGVGVVQLEFTSDDFTGVVNPVISENPTVTLVRTLRNIGNTPLDFEIVLPDTNTILTIDTVKGSIQRGGTVDISITYDASDREEVGIYEAEFTVNYSSPSFSNSFTVDAILEVTDQQGSLPEGLIFELESSGSELFGFIEITNDSGFPIDIKSVTTDLVDAKFELFVSLNFEDLSDENSVMGAGAVLSIDFLEAQDNSAQIDGNLIIESNATNSLLKIPFFVRDQVLSLEPTMSNTINNEQIVTVAPNPITNDAMVYVKGINNTEISSRLVNVLGQDINVTNRITWSVNGHGTIDMSDLKQGYYFLMITDLESGTVYKTKLIKN